MQSGATRNAQFWSGVAATVIAGVILTLMTGAGSWLFGGPTLPVTATLVQVPFQLGKPLDVAPQYIEYLNKIIQRSPDDKEDSGRKGFDENIGIELYNKIKSGLIDVIPVLASGTGKMEIVFLKNVSDTVSANIKIYIDSAVAVAAPDGNGEYHLSSADAFTYKALEPYQSLTIFAWPQAYGISSEYTQNVRILAGGRAVPTTFLSFPGNSVMDAAAKELGGWIVPLGGVFLVGIFFIIAIPFLVFFSINPSIRRKYMTKKEFERILGDVKALYSKFRVDEQNPFS